MKTYQIKYADYDAAVWRATMARPTVPLSFISEHHDDSDDISLIFDDDGEAALFAANCGVPIVEVENAAPAVVEDDVDPQTP